MPEVFDLSASVSLDTSKFDEGLVNLRQRMQQIQQEFGDLSFSVGFDSSSFRTELNRAQQEANRADLSLDFDASGVSDELERVRQEASDTSSEINQLEREVANLQNRSDKSRNRNNNGNTNNDGDDDDKSSLFGALTLSNIAVNTLEGIFSHAGELISTSINLASDLVEVQNVVDVTFDDSADVINEWAQNAINAYGLTETKAKQYASTIGSMFKSMGIADDDVTQMSMDITGLAADMASFYNLDHDTAFEKIRSGISGETEPLKALGINMSVANMNAYALAQGMDKTYDKMTQAEQATLRYQYLLEVTKDAQGDFERNSDSYSNEMRKLQSNLQRIASKFGEGLLQVVTPAVSMLNNLLSDNTYQQTEAEKILNQQKQSLYDAEITYASALKIVSAMREMEAEGGEAVKSTDAWTNALEALKQVMPGLAQYVDLTTDAITGNTDAIDAYVNSIHNMQNASVFDDAVTNAENAVQETQKELQQAQSVKATLEVQIETASSDEVKAVYKNQRDKLFAELKSSFENWSYGDTWEEFAKSQFYTNYKQIQSGSLDLTGAVLKAVQTPGTTYKQRQLIASIESAQEAYLSPTDDLQAQLDAQIAYIEQLEATLGELTNEYEIATQERDQYYISDEGKAGKLQLEFQNAVDAEEEALETLINAHETVQSIRSDTLSNMQKQYSGVASGIGFMVKKTRAEIEELMQSTYSKENVTSWWGDNADVLNIYNEQLKQAQANGVDVGILQNLLTYSDENEALLSQILEISNDPEALAQLNADYQRAREAEQAIAETATEIALANNEDYQEAVQAVHDFYDAFNQADEITTAMAKNNESALAGIDAYGKALQEKLAQYAPILEALYGISPETQLTNYHDYGGLYTINPAVSAKKSKNFEESTVVPIDVDYTRPTAVEAEASTKPVSLNLDYAESAMAEAIGKPVNAGIGATGTESAISIGGTALESIVSAINDAKSMPDIVGEDFLSGVLDKAFAQYDNAFETATSAMQASNEITDNSQRDAFIQTVMDKFTAKIEEITKQTNFAEAPNIFAQDNVLKVYVVNPDEITTTPTIENTFAVDGEAIATAIAPRVNGSIGSGMRVNLMRTKWGDTQ